MSGHGLYFLHCTLGADKKSGLAVYNMSIGNGGNDDQKPSLLVDVTSVRQGFFIQETGTQQSTVSIGSHPILIFRGRLTSVVVINSPGDDGNGIKFTISTTAQSVTDGSQVGRAKFERNLVEYFDVFRDNGRLMLTTNGFICTSA